MPINQPTISFIIPVYNEEKFIAQVLDAVIKNTPDGFDSEIVVIDNGSTDNTIKICEEKNAVVLIDTESTIAGLRNYGVSKAKGDILVFIDADVLLTDQWKTQIVHSINLLIERPMIITGSRYLPTEEKYWLNNHWYQRMTEYDAPYINSGHLITSRILFEAIEGFNAALETAEDYDFCMRAKSKGAEMINNKKLPAIHLGYPDNITDFFNRERWHGRQDFQSWESFLNSKIAWIATFNLILFAFSFMLSLYAKETTFILLYPTIMFVTSMLLTFYKYRLVNPYSAINTSSVLYIYILGRTMSLLDRFFKNKRLK